VRRAAVGLEKGEKKHKEEGDNHLDGDQTENHFHLPLFAPVMR